MVSDAPVPTWNLLGEELGAPSHLQGHTVGGELFVWERGPVERIRIDTRLRGGLLDRITSTSVADPFHAPFIPAACSCSCSWVVLVLVLVLVRS